MLPQIVSLAYKPVDLEKRPPDHYSRRTVERVNLVAGFGIEGDVMSDSDVRQLNVMFAETVAQLQAEGFQTAPGELGEQIVLGGVPPEFTSSGTRLQLGEMAVIELAELREPCGRFERIQERDKQTAHARLGFMARVLVGGRVTVGDSVVVETVGSGAPTTV